MIGTTRGRRIWTFAGMLSTGLICTGCVERIGRIDTRPSGALVFVNDEEIGATPAQFSFTWYGDYDLVFRKPGYETLKTNHRLETPWWQYPPVDFLVECLWPGMIRDVHDFPVYELQPAQQPTTSDLVERAVELRSQAGDETP